MKLYCEDLFVDVVFDGCICRFMMDETIIAVIRFDGMFEIDTKENWGCVNGRIKAWLIHMKCSYNKLPKIVYEATKINSNHF